MAWGAEPGEPPRLVDPHGGQADLAARTLRTVGDPAERFHEDALRMVRAVRLAATLDFEVEPATLAAIREKADNVRRLSGERIAIEMKRLLAADRPSVGLRLMAETGLLVRHLPGSRRATRRAAEQGPRRGSLGSHAPRGRWGRNGAGAHPPRGTAP